ncbi:amidohydrolase family protein [Chromatocurvus halotolerans]|uniref:Imidazolonepropionase-like amidohydrolase n=1 Tax=Chromatocurvus halotolerans TaxID=1132028 RepID=A0A4V2SAA7_9GAMM|nr:amidohydrolase family protein [Chromatocurvus halotolerans]TCO71010.1 imidazolonepropionase-like amidohydrolase [Chromatocurvus halotolerans]
MPVIDTLLPGRKFLFLLLFMLALSFHALAGDTGNPWDVNRPAFSVPADSASIDVDEGTWMSVDMAPDGEHIVFDLLGDLYEMPATGGEARPLTSGHAWDMQPRYSPDGRYIAFTSDRSGGDNIWTLDRDSGDLHQVTHESFRLLNNPSWSPDGDYIAARKHFTTSRSLGTGEIWLYHAHGDAANTGQRVVERPSPAFQKEQGEPAFSADGSGIYFSLNVTPGNTFVYHEDSNTELFQIRRVDLHSGEVSTVAGGHGGAVRATPSPDGRQLAYVKRVRAASRLFVKDLESGRERMLFDELDQDMQETWAVHGLYPGMAWTPDSRELVFWAKGRIWRLAVESGEVSEIPFRVRDSRSVYPAVRFPVAVAPDTFRTKMVRFAQRSPDGSAVVFESLGQLYIKRADAAPVPLTSAQKGFDGWPVWSADSRDVYFLRWRDDELSRVHRVSARGGEATALEHARGQYVELAPGIEGDGLLLRKLDGSQLLNPAWSTKPGLYRLNVSTGELRFVSDRGRHPHAGPEGRIYAQERAESAQGRGSSTAATTLISMTPDGHDIRVVAESELASTIRLSPTGQHVAFEEGQHMYVAARSPSGGTLVLSPERAAFPTVRVSSVGGAYLHWNRDGSTLSWSTGPELRTVRVDDVMQSGTTPLPRRTDLSLAVDAARPDGRLALVNARVITMDANRRVIDKGRVLIENNRIVEVGDASLPIPEDYRQLDLDGKTVMPGLVDIHAHGPFGRQDVIPQQNWNLLAHLALGVTTLHNPSSTATEVFAAAEYAKAGKILAPRIFSTAEIVYGAKSTRYAPIDTLDDALAHVRRLKAQGAISVKNYNQPRRDQRQLVIEAARREGLMPVAEGGALYQMDMNLIGDGITGIEHNVPLMRMYDDVTQYWRQSDAGYTLTLVVTFGGLTSEDYYYQDTEVWKHPILSNFVPPAVLQPRSVRRPMAPEADYRDDDVAAAAKVLLDNGVTINTGGHGQREGLATHWEMWSLERGGFSAMEALAAATINPATYLGMARDIGSIEAEKLADLLILDADPLQNIRHTDRISRVILNGRVYRAQDLAEEVTGEAALAPMHWQGKPESDIR